MPQPHDAYLAHILAELRFLQALPPFADGAALRTDAVQSRAVVRSLEIIALRNRLIHEYMGVNYNIVVDVLTSEVPRLIEQLEGLVPDDYPTQNVDE